MAIKIKQIIDSSPREAILFGKWLTEQGMDSKAQYQYMKSGWLERLSKGVYVLEGSRPTLYAAVSSYNTQLGKQCEIGAYTALDLRGYSHFVPMGKPHAYLFTDKRQKLPTWLLEREWNMTVRYQTTSFLGDGLEGVEPMTLDGFELWVASPERAIMECLNLPDAASGLMDIYYVMEGLTTLRPKLVQRLLERCSSVKVKRLFLYMAEKAGHPWYRVLDLERISLGAGRRMISNTGKYISKYNMTIPRELAEYE
ncbi:MAG: type IV toxin-antitoxin system AbiEi family antitoxin [Bacteroidales bacterium]|nr:type IV toxin-antitoxin system AbiEi family antitoxin [Bacteroidales bacterium]